MCVGLSGRSKQVCEDRQLQSDTVILHQSCSYVFQTPSGGGVFLTAQFSFTQIFIFEDHKPAGFFPLPGRKRPSVGSQELSNVGQKTWLDGFQHP